MRRLVALGADPLLKNAENCTPLMAAAGVGTTAPGEVAGTESEVLEAVKLLLDLGADVNAVDDNGETAMHGAAYKNLPRGRPASRRQGGQDRGLASEEQVWMDAVDARRGPQIRELQGRTRDGGSDPSSDDRRGHFSADRTHAVQRRILRPM